MLKERIGFIGGGKMAEALAKGIINASLSSVDQIIVSDVDSKRCQILEKDTGIKTIQENKKVTSGSDIIILAVKPNIIGSILKELKNDITPKHLDAVTGLSGSGPAFIYVVIEALADGGVKMGLPRDVAITLAAQTAFGAAKMVLESGTHIGRLRDAVTSPGGTTIEGLHALEKGGIRNALINAVEVATKKSKRLGRTFSKRK